MKPARPYTLDEIQAIKSRYIAEGAVVLAREQGRDPRGIRQKAWNLGLRRQADRANSTAHQWTEAEDLRIRKEWGAVTSRRRAGHTVAWLSAQLGLSIKQVQGRAGFLGLRRQRVKEPPWCEAEIELLHATVHYSTKHQRTLFRRAGFKRTETALIVARGRYGIKVHESTDAYSAHGLAKLMGVTVRATTHWIARGWLKAKPRSDARDPNHGGVGDRWIIFPKDVRLFIRDHIGHLDLGGMDKFWLRDLLMSDEPQAGYLQQDHCGKTHAAAGGYEEHGVCA